MALYILKKDGLLCVSAEEEAGVCLKMKNLTHIRIILSIVFLLEALAFVLLGASAPRHTAVTSHLQIVPSMLSASIGATATWIVATLLMGRVYCSTVCPLGTLQDVATFTREKIFRRPISHRFTPCRRIRYDVLIIYAVLTIAGSAAAMLGEPWRWFDGIARGLAPGHDAGMFAVLAGDAAVGVAISVAALALLGAYSVHTGRDFCNHVCPVGTALGIVATRAALHIEIDPDRCTSCMKCEEGCKASCISVKDRVVDNSRCVRCFNCISHCPENAIRLQINRNGVMSPMMRRSTSPTPN